MTNKCNKCGQSISNSYQYCPFCGQKITQVNRVDNLLDLRNHFVIQGVSKGNQTKIQDSYIMYVIDKGEVFNINLKVTMPINESVFFDVCFQDLNEETVLGLRTSPSLLLAEENEIVKVPFTLPAGILSGYNVAIVKYNNMEVFRIDFVPSVISVKIDNSWFNMTWSFGDYYNSVIDFLTWWMLMPNTTHRDIRYLGYNIELREIAGWNNQEKCTRVNQFISALRFKTNLNLSLATINRAPADYPAEWYFNQDDEETNIYVELSTKDYIEAAKLKKLSSNRVYPHSSGMIDHNGEPLTYDAKRETVNQMLQKRYDGWLY